MQKGGKFGRKEREVWEKTRKKLELCEKERHVFLEKGEMGERKKGINFIKRKNLCEKEGELRYQIRINV